MARKTKPPTQARKRAVHLSDELATSLVAESERTTDLPALLKRYDVSYQTYGRMVKRVAADERLAEVVAGKRKQLTEVWDAGLRATAELVMAALQHQARLSMQATTFDPAMVHKLAGALKILNDAATTRGMLLVQPSSAARKDPQPAKTAGVGDRPAGGVQPAVGAGGSPAGAATPAPAGGDPVH